MTAKLPETKSIMVALDDEIGEGRIEIREGAKRADLHAALAAIDAAGYLTVDPAESGEVPELVTLADGQSRVPRIIWLGSKDGFPP